VSSEPVAAAAAEPIVDAFHNHRRVFVYAALLLFATGLIFVGVGKHPGEPGTVTTLPAIGRWDGDVWTWIQAHQNAVATAIAKVLNVIGGGFVTIPLRIAIAVYLLIRRRRRAFVTWILVWLIAEVGLTLAKDWYMRSRPPDPLVMTSGPSFPSGHAVATASIAVALVIVSMPTGSRRRKWEFSAAAAAFVMGLSRVYLNAHWFSDVLAGALLGTAVALGCAALVTEIFAIIRSRRIAGSGASPPTSPPG